jgi:hypothetical protein
MDASVLQGFFQPFEEFLPNLGILVSEPNGFLGKYKIYFYSTQLCGLKAS